MTDSFVTQCPHCQTSFRVSHAQLSVARGVVRCGACLQVFNAAKQLLEQRSGKPPIPVPELTAPIEETQKPVPAPPVNARPVEPTEEIIAPPVEPKKPHALDFDSLDLDNLDLDEELARLEQREIQLPETFSREDRSRDIEPPFSASRDTAETENGQWVDSLLNDDSAPIPDLDKRPEIDAGTETTPTQGQRRTEPSLSFDMSALDALPDDPAPRLSETQARPAHRKELHKTPKENTKRWSAIDDELDTPVEPQEHQERLEPRPRRVRSEPGLRTREQREKPLLDLTDDPLQLDWRKPGPRRGRRFVWGLLIVLALAALAGQYIWYHFDELARQDQYRPWFQQICPLIDCKVPSKVDISLLKSSNLVVRSHPDFKGALVVDAIIYNRASFSQPFPLLELRFSDSNGQPIASRRFKPSEYLSGEMAGKAEMPPQTPIHIALDILDPGTKAVNYSLNFRSPE